MEDYRRTVLRLLFVIGAGGMDRWIERMALRLVSSD